MDPGVDPDEVLHGAGEGGSPSVALDGFSGPLAQLLVLARAQQINIADISLDILVDQLVVALRQAPEGTSLSQKGDWVVMAAWLLQLRSRLLLPADAPAQRAAAAEADQLRERLVALRAMQALAGWLERRPQLGQDVFARGRPEVFGASIDSETAPDIVAFLWASLALFDDTTDPQPAAVYRPVHLDLYVVADARDRIMRLLKDTPGSVAFERLLPQAPEHVDSETRRELLQRSAWSSTFTASLELVKQGNVVVEQGGDFQTIQVAKACGVKKSSEPTASDSVGYRG